MDSCTANRKRIAAAHTAFAKTIENEPVIAEIRQTGTIIAIELKSDGRSYHDTRRDMMYRFFMDRKIVMRPLGNIIYVLPPYCITDEDLEYVYMAIRELFTQLAKTS